MSFHVIALIQLANKKLSERTHSQWKVHKLMLFNRTLFLQSFSKNSNPFYRSRNQIYGI